MKRISALVLSLGLLIGMAGGPLAQPTQAASLKICGEVTVYVKATVLATGLLTINGIPLVIAAGANLGAGLGVGADVCVDLTTNPLGLVSGGAVTANVHTQLKICGKVAAYTAATATTTGVLKIGSRTFTLALGSHLPASVKVGADLCIDLELDGFGRVGDGSVTANAHVHLKLCGEVTAYASATANSTGFLRIAGRTLTTAVDSELPASVKAGADLCVDLTLDGYGRVSEGTASANVEVHVKVCGDVAAYSAASATTTGLLKIAGRTFVLGVGSDLPASVDVGADLCLDLTVNGFGQVSDGTAVLNVTSTLQVCGQATAYAAATSTSDGSLTFAGITRKVAAGADVDAGVKVGAYLKLHLVLDGFARISDAGVLKVGVSVDDACGVVPAPSSGPGASQGPGASPGPGASQAPGGTQDPGATAGPDASQAPGASADPGASGTPASSPGPTGQSGGIVDEPTCNSGIGGGSAVRNGDSLLPSTDALERATGIVASNALPLLAIGLFGAMAAWYRSRRRADALAADAAIRNELMDADAPAENLS